VVKIIWTEPALDDIHSIIEFIAQASVYYADLTARGILYAPKRIKKFPLSGRIVPEFCDTTIREIIHGSYRIIYKTNDSKCFVVAVKEKIQDLIGHR
jgi:plasmid stabilization system protein ParE